MLHLNDPYTVLPRFSFILIIVGFGFRLFFTRIICLGFRRLSRISSACPRNLAANFAKTNGEAASSDKSGTEKVVSEFKNYAEVEEFIPQQVFNCDETGIFWKKIPKRMFITQKEKALQGHKLMKDSLTLLLFGNASDAETK
ncbi:hypothetical protein AVEN_47623-1 [Araneus ventricosus]|uniref:Tigger transposable element-derived protein 1 n=1 Tax=Araneus ventricosus TaxID=182803 RepID=A0A4Y2X4R4_ARAVE|nr:hypothetical protein AVEN_47623-1 [Araneus ventricosus]